MSAAALSPAPSDTSLSELRAIERELQALVAGIDADRIAPERALAWLKVGDQLARLGDAIKTLVGRRVEDANMFRREGHRSAAEQVARETGTTVAAARALLDTSERVADLPATDAALRSGSLSRPQVDAIAAAAEVVPESESRLLELASNTSVRQLRDEALKTKASVGREETYKRIHANRSVREFTDAEGAFNAHVRGPIDAGAQFHVALETRTNELFHQARTEGRHEPREAYAFDALIQLVTDTPSEPVSSAPSAAPADPTPAADDTTAAANAPKRKRSRRNKTANTTLLVRADLEPLVRGEVEGDETCDIPGFGPIPVSKARELLGDAALYLVLTKGQDVVNTTYLGRGANAAQRIALLWQTPQCTNRKCNSLQFQVDHRRDWHKVKETKLENLDGLCGFDHDLKTRYGWALVAGTGRRDFVPPNDPRHPNRTRPPPDTS